MLVAFSGDLVKLLSCIDDELVQVCYRNGETVLIDAAPMTQSLRYALTPRLELLALCLVLRHHAHRTQSPSPSRFPRMHQAFLILLQVGAACLNEAVEWMFAFERTVPRDVRNDL
jgi:hypothetical protein